MRLSDIAIALGLAIPGVLITAIADHSSAVDRPVDLGAYVLVFLAGVALAGRRRWPLPTLAAVTVLTTVYLVIGYPYTPNLVCFAVAIYTVARYRPLPLAAPPALAALPVLLAPLVTNNAAAPLPPGP